MLIAAILATNLSVRAQHMNEKDSPSANVVVTVDLTNCHTKARDYAPCIDWLAANRNTEQLTTLLPAKADVATVDTQQATVDDVVNARQIADAPLNGYEFHGIQG